jgi:hypothetical protein
MNDHEDLRSQIIDAVRQMFESQQAQIARGKPPDAQRLLMTIELLTKLLPPAATDAPSPSQYAGARERLAKLIGNSDTQTDRAAELDARRVENEKLNAEVEQLRQAPPEPKKALPAPDAAPKEKWKPPESWKKGPPEIWRSWMGDGMTWPRMRTSDWGPG